jgi:RNA 3'-terminal phosphate cyclase (ATP)
MITIDGSQGEGGGQILRSSLTLALVTGQAVRLHSIRARRKKPGLMRQHLTAVQAAARVGGCSVPEAGIGTDKIEFRPNCIAGGHYDFAIGTAGSTMLVLQTLLPALLFADSPSELLLEGGTHNPMSPPFDFFAKAYAPLLERMGAKLDFELMRPGFFPAGGGALRIRIEPAQELEPIELLERGELQQRRAVAQIAHLDRDIARRELSVVRKRLGFGPEELEVQDHEDSIGPGNLLTIEQRYEHVTELVTGFGQRGVPAEKVAHNACDELQSYLQHGAPVGEHLADQILLPLALAGGGAFETGPMSLHTKTNIDVIQRFLPVRIQTEVGENGTQRVTLSS